jgi:hypothetical protein
MCSAVPCESTCTPASSSAGRPFCSHLGWVGRGTGQPERRENQPGRQNKPGGLEAPLAALIPRVMASFTLKEQKVAPFSTSPQSTHALPAPALYSVPCTHWMLGIGEPEAWQGRSRDCPTIVFTWPKPSATRSCGGTVDRTSHWVVGAEQTLASGPPKAPGLPQVSPQILPQEAFQGYPQAAVGLPPGSGPFI